jgi:hypothetical protein
MRATMTFIFERLRGKFKAYRGFNKNQDGHREPQRKNKPRPASHASTWPEQGEQERATQLSISVALRVFSVVLCGQI